jgi:outer membrane cobalamin receptor
MRLPPTMRTRIARTVAQSLVVIVTLLVVRNAIADDDAGPTTSIDLPPGGFILRGTVHDPRGTPIPGALVEVLGSSGAPVAQAHSDARGVFELPPLPGDSYRVRVSQSAFTPAMAPLALGPTTAPLDVSLAPPAVQAAAPADPAQSLAGPFVLGGSPPTTAPSDLTLDVGIVAEEVRVTGERAAPPGQTGSSVSVLSRKEIQALPGGDALNLSQIMLTQPGFTNDTFGGDGLLHVRGEESGVLYVLDGIQIPGGLVGQFVDVLSTGLVQSLRLITGGQPVEYGPNVGGVVDITTRHGTADPQGAVQMVYGTYQKAQPSAWYSQAFGKVDVFASARFLTTQRGLDPEAASPILHDGLTSGDAFARVDFRPDDHERLEVLARYSQHHFQIPIDPTLLPLSEGPPGATRGNDIYGNSPPPFVPYNANPTEAGRDLFTSVSYSHAFPNASLQVSPYIRSSYGNLNCDPEGSLGPTADPGSICSNVARNLLHEGQYSSLSWGAGDAQRWKAGLTFDAAQSNVAYTQFMRGPSALGGPDPALTISGTDETNFLSGGAFLQDEITLGNVKLFPGLRADVQDAHLVGTNLPDLVLAGPSARLGFSYSFSKTLVLHGFAGYLWQPPNAVDAAVAARVLKVAPNQALPVDIQAEKDESVEIGLTYRIPRQFDASLTGYGRLSQDTLDVTNVGSTNLVLDYNYVRGRAVGAELALRGTANKYLQGFGNGGWDIDQGQGINSGRFLFLAAQRNYAGWQILDHVQEWTANAGIDLHDESEKSHLAILFQYGSGLRTGAFNNETVPGHSTWNLTLRHRFDFGPLRPEVAVDVFNALDAVYAIRIANGFVGSAYGALRQVDARVTVPFGS